ncbi:EAL domain-containing protein, partial [Acinetobacter baumannii]
FNIEHGLRHALDHDELVLYFQPKVASGDLRLAGVEALLRWRHPEQGVIPPLEFIPVAEESGLMQLVGSWVVRDACRFVRRWRERFGYELTV